MYRKVYILYIMYTYDKIGGEKGEMIMQEILNATDVRKHWSRFNDDVVREGPRFVKRNRDHWAALSANHLKVALSQFSFNISYFKEEDKTVTAKLEGFDIVENGDTKEEALRLVVDELIEYANEYQENFNLYFNAPNRREHFPYILNVLVQDDSEGVKGLIHA